MQQQPGLAISNQHPAIKASLSLSTLWLSLGVVPSLGVWWLGEEATFPVLLALFLVAPLAIGSYRRTRRRRYLAFLALPLVPLVFSVMAIQGDTRVVTLFSHRAVWFPLAVGLPLAVGWFGFRGIVPETGYTPAWRDTALITLGGTACLSTWSLWPHLFPWSDARVAELVRGAAGCYHVERGISFPLHVDGGLPPRFARLDTARWHEGLRGPYPEYHSVLAGRRRVHGPWVQASWRETNDGSIVVDWTHRGLGGFRVNLRPRGADWVGRGKSYTDFRAPGSVAPTMNVRLRRVACADRKAFRIPSPT